MEIFLPQYAAVCVVTLLIGWLVQWVYKWVNPACDGVLPPGSMGFPVIGETLQFFRTSSSLDVPNYYKLRWKRYGPVFKTSLFGRRVIASMDGEVNRFVFQQEGKLFRSWYGSTTNSMMGRESMVTYEEGSVHRNIKSLQYNVLRHVLLDEIEENVRQSLTAWAAQPSIEVKDAVATMIFDLLAKKLLGVGPDKSRELRKNFQYFIPAMISFPFYFPGTTFYKSMQGRKNLQKELKALLKERLISTPERRHDDFLDQVADELRRGGKITDEKLALDTLSGLLLAGFTTIMVSMTVGMKYLTDNPAVVQGLKEEHEAILKRREDISSGLTWDDYKSMSFTSQVISEIVRLANVSPGIFRETLTDVKIKGYTIPAGWLVLISPTSVHLNPEFFQEPMAFNPWRWQDEAKRGDMLKNFIPYGGGKRLCTGAEFSKIHISVFLHTLVTKYRWKEIKGGGVRRIAELLIPNDYHIQVTPRDQKTG
uniref:Uncharacterized protein n=1 Tax=Avena sativa TaxID=4498 RepID=A0ACD5UW44_AVESA